MILNSYFSSVVDGIQFLIALASIIGLLGIVIGLLMFLQGYKQQAVKLIIICFIIVGITGMYTGVKYFHIR